MIRALPWVAGFVVPSALLAVVYLTQGNNPAWGLVAGVIGLVGALSAELAQIVLERRDQASVAPDLGEQFAQGWAAGSEETTEDAGKITAGLLRARVTITNGETGEVAHEGVARLHRDIRADERRTGPPDYEPPTRG